MTQTLCFATPNSSSVTLTSPVLLFSSSAPFALQAAPSPAKVRHRYRRETLARYFRIRRGEKRECAPAAWGKDSDSDGREDAKELAQQVACEEIVKSWQDVGLDVLSSGEPMPQCTPMQLEVAIQSFFGGSANKKML